MPRFFEIDFLRGIAIIAMIAFHALFDLNYFAGYSFPLHKGAFFLLGRFASVTFIFLVGLSLSISYNRARQQKTKTQLFQKYFFRGAKIFSLGLLITAVTWLLFPKEVIVFGVLHFIGLAIILSFPFLGRRKTNLLIGILFILSGFWLQSVSIPSPLLLWVGFTPVGFYSFDYFPLLPWFGLVLLGLFSGNMLYSGEERKFSLPDLSKNRFIGFFSFLGRNSLLIYFLHQPVLVAVILLL